MKCGLLLDSSAKQWIWLAIDSDSREIVGMHVGSRDRTGAEALWKSYHQSTVDAPFVTPIFGLHMSRFFPLEFYSLL